MRTNHDLSPAGASVDTAEARLLVLHTLRLGGFVTPEAVSSRTGLPDPTVRDILTTAASDNLTIERSGRISGWSLTPAGQAEHAQLLAEELEQKGARGAVEAANDSFLRLNQPFKEVCSRWQVKPDGQMNDHSDKGYDDAVIEELRSLHDQIVPLTEELSNSLARFGRYPRSFTAAYQRLIAGERRAFAAPLSDSYHDTWMELHQDFLSTLGRTRSAADGH